MCALFGWIDYKGIVGNKVLQKLTQALATASEERGTDATGIAYVKGKKLTVYKRPKAAHKLNFKIPEGTHCIMGHTRFATQGKKEDNFNNHPFLGFANVPFALAHNGCIWNDELLRKVENLPYTNIKTDSYIAVQLLEHLHNLDEKSIIEMSERVRGTFNFTILDENNILYIIKGNNPMVILHFETLGLYIYASTKTIIDKALKNLVLRKFSNEVVKIDEGEILRISRKGKITRSTFTMTYDYADFYGYGHDENLSLYEEELNDVYFYADYMGVSEATIDELYDYGYTTDDIYDLIFDKESLEQVLHYIRGEEYDTERLQGDYMLY